MTKDIYREGLSSEARTARPCIFCKIVSDPSQAAVILETSRLLVITALEEGYPLILTKKHFRNLLDPKLDEQTSRDLGTMQMRMARAVARMENADVSLFINNGSGAGQQIDHLHAHIIPRDKDKNDGKIIIPRGKTLDLAQLRSKATLYRKALKNLQIP